MGDSEKPKSKHPESKNPRISENGIIIWRPGIIMEPLKPKFLWVAVTTIIPKRVVQ